MIADLKFKVSEANQLWIRWKSISRDGDGKLHLKGAEFYGPVLGDCEPLEKKGHIIIDLTSHYLVIIPRPYFVKISWENIIAQEMDKVKFSELLVEDNDLGHLNKLNKSDSILLDCTEHTREAEAAGIYKMAFQAMVYKDGKVPYDFTK